MEPFSWWYWWYLFHVFFPWHCGCLVGDFAFVIRRWRRQHSLTLYHFPMIYKYRWCLCFPWVMFPWYGSTGSTGSEFVISWPTERRSDREETWENRLRWDMGPGQSHVPAFDAAGCCLRSWWSTSGNSLGFAFNWAACDAPGCCCIAGGHQWQLFNLSTVGFFLGYVIHWLSWFSQSDVATEQTLGHSSPKLWTVGSDINSVITSIKPRKARIYIANKKCDVYDVFSPQTGCPHWGVLMVGVKAGAWSGCWLWAPAFFPLNFRIK